MAAPWVLHGREGRVHHGTAGGGVPETHSTVLISLLNNTIPIHPASQQTRQVLRSRLTTNH